MKAALMKKLSFISPITYEHIKKEVAQFESF
jgi:hypothetical protein